MNTNDSTAVTFSQVYNDFKGAISGIGEALKVGAEHVYEVLVRQQVVISVSYLIGILIGSVFCYFILSYSFKNMYETNRHGHKEFNEGTLPFFLVGGFLCIGLLLFTIAHIGVIVTGFVNPEYGAIMEIKSFIK